MMVNAIPWDVLKPFADESCQALNKTADFTVEVGEAFQEKIKDFRFKGYAIVVNTTGSVFGRILIHHYTETAMAIANRILDRDNQDQTGLEMNDEISNTLAEFSLDVVEAAVANLAKRNLKVKVSPAYFIKDTQHIDNLLADVSSIITVPMTIKNVGRFYINYLLEKGH